MSTRKELRDRFFLQTAKERIEVILEPATEKTDDEPAREAFIVEMKIPSEAEFQDAQAKASEITVSTDGGASVKSDTHGAIELIVRACTYVPGTDELFFEPADPVTQGPMGGYYSKLRSAANEFFKRGRSKKKEDVNLANPALAAVDSPASGSPTASI